MDLTVCGELKANGQRCEKHCAEGDTKCKLHRTVADRREQDRRMDMLWGEALDTLWAGDPIQDFAVIAAPVEDAFDRGWITRLRFETLAFRLVNEWAWYQRIRNVPTATAKTELQRLAQDAQNVHTEAVNKQTSAATTFLLEASVPEDQDTPAELETAWADKASLKKVMKDVAKWYKVDSCVAESDWLYKRMLDGLWARIKLHKERAELTQRLWEEAFESVGMCCQGHLSRLANVLVGFTEEVKTELPVGELLQAKIAAIAAKDISVEEKVCEAWVVFEELKVPVEERDAWIEAF